MDTQKEQATQAHITCAKCGCEHLSKGNQTYLVDVLYDM